MTNFSRGDVVLVDLGMMAKTRPCVVIPVPQTDRQRNMSVVVPMTTEIRGGQTNLRDKPVDAGTSHVMTIALEGNAGHLLH